MRDNAFTVGVLTYPGVSTSAVAGIHDVFTTANQLTADDDQSPPRFRVQNWDLRRETRPGQPPFDAVVVPPSLAPLATASTMAPLPWVVDQHAQGTLVCGVCAGTLLLAKTGLLDGRPVTSHWLLTEPLATHSPKAELDVGRPVIDDGDLITAAGVTAWVDVALKLVERFAGPSVREATARLWGTVGEGADPPESLGGLAFPGATFAHGDRAVMHAQRWLQANHREKGALSRLAEGVGLGERTLLRRFQRATGLTPIRYLQQLRVAMARNLLVTSSLSVHEVAWAVGYHDVGAFRRVFRRIAGVTPSAYRAALKDASMR